MTASENNTVLIVGAGPTGLTLATVLARYGVPVRLIEKKSRLSRHTKATNLMQRNQELIFALGLLDPLNEMSGRMSRLMVHAYGKCFGPRTMHLKESPFPDVLLCGQHNFEAVVARGLEDLQVPVEFDTELTGLTQDSQGCRAELNHAGRTESGKFRYVVGCDGYAGATRTFTKLNFTPLKTGVGIRQVDCRLTWHRLSTMEQMWLFYFNRGFAVVVPLPGGIHRVLSVEPKSAFPQREPTLDEMQSKLREATSDPSLTLSDPEWFSYTDLSMGIAPSFRDRNILLAGDSGNPVLPNGGQGMNTGIGDAFNLGWKLAAVLRHGASQALLDTYNQERHALRTSLQKAQFNSLKYTTLQTPKPMQWAFRALAEPLLNAGGEYKMAQAFSELTLNTRKSPLTLETLGTGGLRAGDRALDSAAVLGTRSMRLYDFIYQGRWTLLAFTGRAARPDSSILLQTLAKLSQPGLAAFVISTDSRLSAPLPVVYDLDEEVHRTYGVVRPTIFLVRPDGYIGARARPADSSKLTDYLARWVPNPSQQFVPNAVPALKALA